MVYQVLRCPVGIHGTTAVGIIIQVILKQFIQKIVVVRIKIFQIRKVKKNAVVAAAIFPNLPVLGIRGIVFAATIGMGGYVDKLPPLAWAVM